MYILTINYLDGTISVDSCSTFLEVQGKISSIDRLVDSLEMYYQVEADEEPIEDSNIDETSHLSWGI